MFTCLAAVCGCVFVVPGAVNHSHYSSGLRRLVWEMLAKDPAKRPTITSIMTRDVVQVRTRVVPVSSTSSCTSRGR